MGGVIALLTRIAQGLVLGSIFASLIASLTLNPLAIGATIILTIFIILPILLAVMSYSESVFTTEKQKMCKNMGLPIGLALIGVARAYKALNAGANASQQAGVGWSILTTFLGITFTGKADDLLSCFE